MMSRVNIVNVGNIVAVQVLSKMFEATVIEVLNMQIGCMHL